MSIFSRIPDIINSNINALLDRAEDPEKMVRLIIQEMEETLVEVRTTSARAIADKKELSRRAGAFRDEAEEWERKAELAVSKGRDDLARAALAERRKSEDAAKALEGDLEILEDTLDKLGTDIAALEKKIKDAKARQNAIVLRGQAAQSRLGVRRQLSNHNIDEQMQRFENYERKMDDLEGQVESYDMGQRDLRHQINDLANEDVVDQELQALKARVGKGGKADQGRADKADRADGADQGRAGKPADTE